jgi:hypothetical protein
MGTDEGGGEQATVHSIKPDGNRSEPGGFKKQVGVLKECRIIEQDTKRLSFFGNRDDVRLFDRQVYSTQCASQFLDRSR